MTTLATPLKIRDIEIPNRIMTSPMCTYGSPNDGTATDWHLVHYGKFAIGGAGIVMVEATAVEAEGRHCYSDLGIWDDAHITQLERIAQFIKAQGSVPAIQLQHTGRKAAGRRPWHGGGPLNDEDAQNRNEPAWQAIGPSAIPFGPNQQTPRELASQELPALIAAYVDAAKRAVRAGFEIIEVHAAHGYLLNQFLSPIANQRTDEFGGSLENRMRFPLQVVQAVRDAIPNGHALFVRISSVDGVDGGWTIEESITFSKALKSIGVDAVDCSSGGIGGAATMNRLARKPGFQIPFAHTIKEQADIATIAVGLILTPEQAHEVVQSGQADIVAIGREALANPNWPNAALTALDDENSFDHWQSNIGWWLERRSEILREYESNQR